MLNTQLSHYFGFKEFLPGQKNVIQCLVDGKSAAAIFPTGGGKSLCYQLPAMILDGLTLVVSPLLSLMQDQLEFMHSKNLPAARLDSTLSFDQYNQVLEDAKSGAIKLLLISPERFKNERFRMHLKMMKIALLVIDEAHCISEWGHNFRPDYLKLPIYKTTYNIPQVLLLTATASKPVQDDMLAKFEIPNENLTNTGFYRPNLFLQISDTKAKDRLTALAKRIQEAPADPTIVYVTLQKTAESVSKYLVENGINSKAYHAGLQNEERAQIQSDFMQDKTPVIVATIAFGMGIDKHNIRRIIHFDIPKSIENYCQEIGRAGRDGQPAFCEVLFNTQNIPTLENFVYGDTPEKPNIRTVLEQIKNNKAKNWEVSLYELAEITDIRILTLKTLIVYLELLGIVSSKTTFFRDYIFKELVSRDEILSNFSSERKKFIQTMFNFSPIKKTWATVDIESIKRNSNSNRERVVKALDYLATKEWIELRVKNAVEVFEIITPAFDIESLTQELFELFEKKEEKEVARIHQMLEILTEPNCLNKRLSKYFNEKKETNCGHCVFCKIEDIKISKALKKIDLKTYVFQELTQEFFNLFDNPPTKRQITRFLCGITSPQLSKKKCKTLPQFGVLDHAPFKNVNEWVSKQ